METHKLSLEGEYDLARRDEIARLFDLLDGDGAVIDLTNVTYLDSTILNELARLRRHGADRSVLLTGANAHIRRLFKVVRFDEVFDIADTTASD